jgi:hypothetical protein
MCVRARARIAHIHTYVMRACTPTHSHITHIRAIILMRARILKRARVLLMRVMYIKDPYG